MGFYKNCFLNYDVLGLLPIRMIDSSREPILDMFQAKIPQKVVSCDYCKTLVDFAY